MKKKVLLVAAVVAGVFATSAVNAQDQMTSKKGTPILPEAGDYAIGLNANNLTGYFGNMFNGASGNNATNLGFLPQNNDVNTVYGKYFVDANKAYRGVVRLGLGTTNQKTLVQDATSTDPTARVENEAKTNNFAINVGGGLETRRGAGRLQGVYGPMAMIGFATSGTENTFGNDLTASNNNGGAGRVTETSNGSTINLDLGGFAGVEYFFAPKMSIGAEIAWTIRLQTTGNGETTTEAWNGTSVVTTTAETGGNNSFSFDNRPVGNLSVNFHF